MSIAICLAVIAAFGAIVAKTKSAVQLARHAAWSPAKTSIVLVEVDSGTSAEEMQATAAALQAQVTEDFYPAWGVSATVRVATPQQPLLPGESRVEYRKTPQPGDTDALAVHDIDEHGVPMARVYPVLCKFAGETPSKAASHEVCELLADPLLTECVQLPDGRIAAKEVCDQVQAQGYKKGDVEVSNFCTPQNFAPSKAGGDKYDFLGILKSSFQVADGGYAQFFDPSKGWQMVGAMTGYRALLAHFGIPTRASRRGKAAS